MLALRKAEKEEEKRAREKIRQKLEEDKVCKALSYSSLILVYFFMFLWMQIMSFIYNLFGGFNVLKN